VRTFADTKDGRMRGRGRAITALVFRAFVGLGVVTTFYALCARRGADQHGAGLALLSHIVVAIVMQDACVKQIY
jgi:hypothetical protein